MQDYTHEFRRRALILGVNLSSKETLLNYIGGLHNYLTCTILMFNQTNLNEVCVQATYLEAWGKHSTYEKSDSFLYYEGKGNNNFNGKGKKNGYIKIEKEKIAYKRCSKNGHDEDHFW